MRPFIAIAVLLHLGALAMAGTFTQSSAVRTYTRSAIRLAPDGSGIVSLVVTNAAGRTIDHFDVLVPVSGAIVDSDGNQLAASVPAGVSSARTSYLTAIDAAIDAAATAGKFVR